MKNILYINGNSIYTRSKNVKYRRYCNTCHRFYVGWGKFYCSKKCRRQPTGENSPSWKGNKIKKLSGYTRAEKIPTKPCQLCGKTNSERHHHDRNPINNSPENIIFVCRKCHKLLHINNIPTIIS